MLYSTGSSYNWGTVTASTNVTGSGLHVSSDAVIEGDLTVQGISIVKTLEKINERLAILVPDPKKLEKYKALKKAYDNYKTLEALIQENDTKDSWTSYLLKAGREIGAILHSFTLKSYLIILSIFINVFFIIWAPRSLGLPSTEVSFY
jgi:hypothetical protein